MIKKHSYQVSSKLVDWFKGLNTGQRDTQTACGSLTDNRLRKIIYPDYMCVAGCSLHHSPRIPLTPISANDELEDRSRQKTGKAGYMST